MIITEDPNTTVECRYCGQVLSFTAKPKPFRIDVPCHRCHYLNVLEDSFVQLALDDLSRNVGDGRDLLGLSPSQDPKTIYRYLYTIAGQLLDTLIQRVHAELPIAQSALISVLARRERLVRTRVEQLLDFAHEPRTFPRVASLLWGILGQFAGLTNDMPSSFNSAGVAQFLPWFNDLAEKIINIADMTKSTRRGETRAEFDGERFTFTQTERHTLAVGSVRNSRRFQLSVPQTFREKELFPEEAIESQRLVLGFSARDIADMAFNGFEKLRTRTSVFEEKGLYFIKLPKHDLQLRQIIMSCTQTPKRLRQFRTPFFFDLGIRAHAPMAAREAILNAAANNWAYYYPLCSVYEIDGETECACTSTTVMSQFLVTLAMQKNALIEELISEAKLSCNATVAEELATLVKRGSNELELEVSRIARSSGWTAKSTSPSLPCGDIDSIALRQISKENLLIAVCEVKDADLPAHRPNSWERQAETAKKAINQLNRKAKWVAENWRKGFGTGIAPEFDGSHGGVIIKVLVTRNHLPLEISDGAECVPLPALARFFSEIRNGLPPWHMEKRRSSSIRF